jgi:predicted Rossmann fold nucleotide-binding protein DprA/Smf involved in DNA uptake
MRVQPHTPAPQDCTEQLPALVKRTGVSGLMGHGNFDLLDQDKLALFCSARCPASLILRLYDALRYLREAGQTFIGGFHSPLEQEALLTLLRGRGGVIVCPARSIDKMRVPPDWQEPLAENRLLVLSPFDAREERVTARLAARRNEFVATVADRVLVVHAEPGSRTAKLAQSIIGRGTPLLTLPSPENKHLLDLGAVPLDNLNPPQPV